jgi:hypothetical protein
MSQVPGQAEYRSVPRLLPFLKGFDEPGPGNAAHESPDEGVGSWRSLTFPAAVRVNRSTNIRSGKRSLEIA